MKHLLTACAAVALAASTFGAVRAQEQAPAGGGGIREACAADMQKLCAGIERPQMRECMRSHSDQLSDGCKAAIAARMAARQQSAAPATTPAPDPH